jgi:hypothetical protein
MSSDIPADPVLRLQPSSLTKHNCLMAIPKCPLSPVPWEQDSFLQVKVEEEEEEAGLTQGQESSPTMLPTLKLHACTSGTCATRRHLAPMRH